MYFWMSRYAWRRAWTSIIPRALSAIVSMVGSFRCSLLLGLVDFAEGIETAEDHRVGREEAVEIALAAGKVVLIVVDGDQRDVPRQGVQHIEHVLGEGVKVRLEGVRRIGQLE